MTITAAQYLPIAGSVVTAVLAVVARDWILKRQTNRRANLQLPLERDRLQKAAREEGESIRKELRETINDQTGTIDKLQARLDKLESELDDCEAKMRAERRLRDVVERRLAKYENGANGEKKP